MSLQIFRSLVMLCSVCIVSCGFCKSMLIFPLARSCLMVHWNGPSIQRTPPSNGQGPFVPAESLFISYSKTSIQRTPPYNGQRTNCVGPKR